MLADGYAPAYVDGFLDGEHSGYRAAGDPYHPTVKDTSRYKNDSEYRRGWDDGYSNAKKNYQNIRRDDLSTAPRL